MTSIEEVAKILENLKKNADWSSNTSLTPKDARIVVKIIERYFEKVL